jgi:methyl-accepting chemotaxis protein
MTETPENAALASLGPAMDMELLAVHRQVEQVRDIVLDAVTKLGDGFEKISAESLTQQSLLQKSLRTVGDSGNDTSAIAKFVAGSQQLTGTMLSGLEQANRRTVVLAEKLEAVLPVLRDLSELSRCIQDSANQIRYLAMNATLEASRSGQSGHGFSVVANAVKELALEFNAVSRRMDDNVESVRSVFEGVASEAKAAVEVDAELARQARTQSAHLDQQTRGLNEELSEQLRTAQDIGLSIQQGVNLCVRGLQFGDLVVQLCGLSLRRVETLGPIAAQVAQWATLNVSADAPTDLFEKFEHGRAGIGVAVVQQTSLETGDIELF